MSRTIVKPNKVAPNEVYLVMPKEDDGNGYGFIQTTKDGIYFYGPKKTPMVPFTHGLNVFKRDEHDRWWVCDEIDLSEFDLFYATTPEKTLFRELIKTHDTASRWFSELMAYKAKEEGGAK
jgi:hypothetical protein